MLRSTPLLFAVLALLGVASVHAAQPSGDSASVSEASSCTISQECWDGSTVSCTGSPGTCTSGSNWVSCNGTRYRCPSTSCEAQIQCPYGGFISCIGSIDCEEGSDYVYCGGAGTLTCDECFPQFICSIS